MAKVTLHELPEGPSPPSVDSEVITDSLGRKLTLKESEILQESRLVKVLGDAAMNQAYMIGYVTPAAMVVDIDGVECDFPITEKEVDAAIVRLGREGLMAIMDHLTKKAREAADKQKAALKNS